MAGDVIGRGVIEVSADSTKLKAGIEDAKRSINSLGVATNGTNSKASNSIDRYIGKLVQQNAMLGRSGREAELHKLALRGASDAQLKAADSAIKLTEAYQRNALVAERVKSSMATIGAIAAAGLISAAAAFDNLAKKAGDFQDLAEKTGDTAENLASLAVAAGTAGTTVESVAQFSIRLTKGLTGVDDESKKAGAAIKALGLDLENFKSLKPADQMEALGKALNSFADGTEKTAVMEALGKGAADLLPFLKELGAEGGRQVILTQQQIDLADAYADRQAKLSAELSLHAQAIATDMLPAMNAFTSAIAELAKDQQFAATASDILKGAMSAGIVVFQTIAVVAAEVGLTFLGVGREIGAIAAQLVALANLDFAGFSAISDAVTADAARARAEVDRFNAKIMAIGQPASPADPSNYSNEGRGGPRATRPKLAFNGATKKGAKEKDTAGQEAKSQLAYDLEQIRKATDAEISIYANAEKIMQARRAANLVNDADYYAGKLEFIQLNGQAQEAALLHEIERMQREKLSGKEKLDNDRKILDAEAKLAKVRSDSVANVTVNGIQEAAANKKIAQSYVDARIAAQAYIDTVNRQNARTIAGVGKGEEFRANQAGINAIEDKQTTQRQGLESDLRRGDITKDEFDTYLSIVNDTYTKEVAAYSASRDAIKVAQGDWMNGASEALANYQSNAENVAGNSAAMFTNAFEGMTEGVSSSISKAIVYGESLGDSLKNVALGVADAFISSFIKIQIQKLFIDKSAASLYAGTIAAQSQAMVAMAGLAAFASTAAIPIVGPAAAPGAAAAAIALAEGFALAATTAAALSVASAEGGFDIPAGVNPLTQLHEKEMVLPQAQANVIRDLAKNGGAGSNGGAEGMKLTIVNNTTGRIDKVEERQISPTERALIISESIAATAAQFGDPNSNVSRSMGRNFNVPRSR